MIKHVGKHNGKKCVIVFRQIPEAHDMALVVYSDFLPRLVHDSVMAALESAPGQNTTEFADVLFRTIMSDGENCLTTLHTKGFLKKAATNQILVTPTTNSSVRLDELNDLLNEMAKGQDAIDRLQSLEDSKGYGSVPRKAEILELGQKTSREAQGNATAEQLIAGVLTDDDINASKISQANAMEAEATNMLAEAKRLKAEAGVAKGAKRVGTKTTTKTKKKQTA